MTQENAELKDYLDRILLHLDGDQASLIPRPDSASSDNKPEVEMSLKMAYMERRLKRAESNLGDLVWMLDRLEHSRDNG